MPLWGYPIVKNYQKGQWLRGAWSAAPCTVRGIKSRPLRFFFAVAARAASVIGFLFSCKKNFFRFFFRFLFFFQIAARQASVSEVLPRARLRWYFQVLSRTYRSPRYAQGWPPGGTETTWKYHRDSMVIPCIFRYYCQKNFPGVAEKFSQLPENFSGKKI